MYTGQRFGGIRQRRRRPETRPIGANPAEQRPWRAQTPPLARRLRRHLGCGCSPGERWTFFPISFDGTTRQEQECQRKGPWGFIGRPSCRCTVGRASRALGVRRSLESRHRKTMALGEISHDAKHGRKAMKKVALALAAVALTLSAGSALAQKKQLVIVVKGLDNPFFEAIHQGCEKWNKENASSPYACVYTGPASTSDEAGEAQIVGDVLGKPDTAAIAISPSNAPLIANAIKAANPKMPVMTLDADL